MSNQQSMDSNPASNECVIRAESLSKKYRLGVISRKMLVDQIESYVARKLGRTDPHSSVHEKDTHIMPKRSDFWALKDVSFEISKGDIVGIMGRNGSGKSTLLKLLSRITAPTEGRAMLKGRVASLLEVGTGFHHELTGRENVYLNGSILGLKKKEIDDRYDQILAFSEIEKFMDTPVKRYSSGMRVRLAFAVAAHLDPAILILDEVLAVGDAAFQEKCLQKIEDTKNSGVTILFVSHSAESVRRLCTRAVVLKQGRIVCDAPAKEAVNYYTEGLHLHGVTHYGVGTLKAEFLGALTKLLSSSLPDGHVLIDLPIETNNGIQIVDVAWISGSRLSAVRGEKSYAGSPDICVIMAGCDRAESEIVGLKEGFLKSGAKEVWIVSPAGEIVVRRSSGNHIERIIPSMPKKLEVHL
jgi:ABC-type polysaccharide/polyol phosphate transport system ATPase subunit